MELRPRLKAAADMLYPKRLTVDIGTDHAYLPAYLVLSGKADRVLACDIGEKPLENAARTLERYSLEDSISLRISDGLQNVDPSEAEEISVCGMGGTLIADILSAAPWIKRDGIHLVLQPNTHAEDVREYLCKNGFHIEKEVCLKDTGRLYCCISAVYDGVIRDGETGFYYFGTLSQSEPLEKIFISNQIKRVRKRFDALTEAQRFPEEREMLAGVIRYYGERYDDKC